MTCIAKIKSPRWQQTNATPAQVGTRCPCPATHGRHCYTHARDYETRWAEMDERAGVAR